MKKIITFVLSMLLFSTNVYASSCTYEEEVELNSVASNVSISYEALTSVEEYDDGALIVRSFKIYITNITEDIYVVVKNDYNNEEYTFYASDTEDGIVTFDWNYSDGVTNFTMYVYSSSTTNCPSEKLKTSYLVTPMYNYYSKLAICDDLTDFSYCQEFITFEIKDYDTFYSKLASYEAEKAQEEKDNEDSDSDNIFDVIFNFINTYKWYILGGIIIVVGGSIIIYRVSTRKQRELGLK